MAKPLVSQVFEDNLIMLPEASPEASEVAPEASDNALSKSVQNNPAVLAARYGVSDRTIQNWVKRLINECNIPDSQLRIQHGIEVEYSAYCIELLDRLIQYRQVHGPKKIGQWFSSLESQKENAPQFLFPVSDELSVVPRLEPVSDNTIEHKKVSIVLRDAMHIDTANQTTVNKVRSALALRRAAVEKPVPVMPVFNGQADALMSKALMLNDSVNAYEQHIEESETALQERRESVQDASELIQLNIDRIGELRDRESKMIQVGLELSQAEQEEMTRLEGELKKLLADVSGQDS